MDKEFKNKYNNIFNKIVSNELNISKLEEFLDNLENRCICDKKEYVSFKHAVEFYYYNFFTAEHDKKILIKEDVNYLYSLVAQEYEKNQDYDSTEKNYLCALKWNPVNLDTIFNLIEIYKKEGKLKEIYDLSLTSFKYACTRSDLSHIYRNLGYYYLEIYRPEAAGMLYHYSRILYETDCAEKEIHFLECALGKKIPKYNVTEIQKCLEDNNIPSKVNKDTLALTYQAANDLYMRGNLEASRQCYMMANDLLICKNIKDTFI